VPAVSWACWAISLPRSQVSVWRNGLGKMARLAAIASRTAWAPCPTSADDIAPAGLLARTGTGTGRGRFQLKKADSAGVVARGRAHRNSARSFAVG
jgi:hypothetical protein